MVGRVRGLWGWPFRSLSGHASEEGRGSSDMLEQQIAGRLHKDLVNISLLTFQKGKVSKGYIGFINARNG